MTCRKQHRNRWGARWANRISDGAARSIRTLSRRADWLRLQRSDETPSDDDSPSALHSAARELAQLRRRLMQPKYSMRCARHRAGTGLGVMESQIYIYI